MSLTGDRLRPRKKGSGCGAFALKVRRAEGARKRACGRGVRGRARTMLVGHGLSYSGG